MDLPDSAVPATQSKTSEPKPMRLLITGANGMIGHALLAAAQVRGDHAVPVQRPAQSGAVPAAPGTILWQPEAAQPFADLEQLEGFDAVVHLAGANISDHRWTPEYKRTILDSRTSTTGALALALARLRRPPRVLLCASATGFYGSCGDEVLTESSAPGGDFLAGVCQAWENAASPAVAAGIRVASLRFGVVLTPFGGALKQMLPIFRAGLGGKLAGGRQWTSWITLEDLLAAVFHVAEHDELSGAVNVVAPGPVRNSDFTRALGKALHRPAFMPVPAIALRAAFGQVADGALLVSCRAMPEKLIRSGFKFSSPEIGGALGSMLANAGGF